ncbi:MAG: tRNA pseudouridine(38-40) synthase TruA [Clostridia bacterium]|nr:tRNA pseudouridine(38-40) synthase TruA [Clostridia bacterium]
MKNYLLTLMFDGRSFHGWQVQKNAVTVQQCVQDGVQRILGVRENIIGCSRTDSGVHANMFCCNIRTEKNINLTSFRRSLNAVLPDSIAVTDITEVPYEFHARYNCKRKEYEYLLFNADYMNPFYVGRALYYPYSLDEKLINDNSKDFIGTHDFSAFCASGSSVEDKVRSVFSASFEKNGELASFKICADGFLYNMVRIIVGTLLDINSGKLPSGSVPEIINSLDRSRAGFTADGCGLYLNKVIY